MWALPEVRWAAAATVLFCAGLLTEVAGGPGWLSWTLLLACYVTGGWEPGWAGLQALRDKTLDVDLLMVLAAIGAAAIGQVLDGGLLIFIFATSGALEAVATQRTAESVRGLLDLAPERATRLTGTCEASVDTGSLTAGDVILVRPGERIGAYGEVLDGASDVDQATITGEGLPAAKAVGDEVFAGTSNGGGALRVRVTRPAHETVVARIVAMVEQASATKAKTQLFIEKIEQRYSIGMVGATVALFAMPLLWGAELQPTLLRAMTFMIVASPCAVVLATMPPLLCAMANAGRHGVLVKSAVVMEQLGQVSRVAFDKTGTLTEGTPRLTDIRPLTGSGLSDEDLLGLAAAVEYPSEHPLAGAVVAAAQDRDRPCRRRGGSVPPRGWACMPLSPVPGSRSAHRRACWTISPDPPPIASPRWCLLWSRRAAPRAGPARWRPGRGARYPDRLRPDAAATVAALGAMIGATPLLLTGDNPRAAAALVAEVGIGDVRPGIGPGQARRGTGIASGGPAGCAGRRRGRQRACLAAAHTGIAMGKAGSDLTLDTADGHHPRRTGRHLPPSSRCPAAPAASSCSRTLAVAALFITGLVILDLLGHLPLPLGVAGHEGSTVIVGLNGLRLLRTAAWHRASPNRGSR